MTRFTFPLSHVEINESGKVTPDLNKIRFKPKCVILTQNKILLEVVKLQMSIGCAFCIKVSAMMRLAYSQDAVVALRRCDKVVNNACVREGNSRAIAITIW